VIRWITALYGLYIATLAYHVKSRSAGYDSRGFRNEAALAHPDIVVIGDSQTWRSNVSRDQAWPQILSKQLNRTVHNMGMQGYGHVQYAD
jgi:hypothetical protein